MEPGKKGGGEEERRDERNSIKGENEAARNTGRGGGSGEASHNRVWLNTERRGKNVIRWMMGKV